MDLVSLTAELTLKLKEKGYKKNRLTWYKSNGEVTVIFAVQKSAYGSDVWYYCFGICLEKLISNARSISHCQIQERADMCCNGHTFTADEILHLIDRWESMYGEIGRLKKKAVEGNLPRMSTAEAVRYLTTVTF